MGRSYPDIGEDRRAKPPRHRLGEAALLVAVLLAAFGLVRVAKAQVRQGGSHGQGPEFFETHIRPVLSGRCSECHAAGAKPPKGGLTLDTPAGIRKGGDSGPVIVPGDPDASLLVRAIRHSDEGLKMPPGRRLPPEQVSAFERWVRGGAPMPSAAALAGRAGAVPTAPADHWAFRPARDPVVLGNPAGSATDAFLLDRLAPRGLRLAPPADKPTLLRRATYDLTGLPPTPGELRAFLDDDSPAAFARVVDRLLASPAYGERWARHWLDLVRYCDDFEDAWRYRDWVVRAFNGDLPFDKFVVNQIAGDLLADPEPGGVNADGVVATTVLALGPWGGIDRRKRLADAVDDQIDTVGRTFLALTLACARCHDHKFDPVTTEDYYGLAGIFLSSRVQPEAGYLSHATPRLRVPLVPPVEVERYERHAARVRDLGARLRSAADARSAAFAAGLLRQLGSYLVAAWDGRHRPPGEAGAPPEKFAGRRGLNGLAVRRWAEYLAGPRLGRYRLLDQPAPDFDGETGVRAWRTAAERPWWAHNSTGTNVGIETFLLPPHSVSVNPGAQGGAVGWRSPVTGAVLVQGRLTDLDPHDGVGVVWALDHESPAGRRELASGGLPNGGAMRLDEGRGAGRLASIPVRAGDVLYLQVVLGRGDAHYDITGVELTVSLADGSARWDLARDVAVDFLAGNPHGDRHGNAEVWAFHDMAGSHRLARMPAVDGVLASLWDAVAADVAAGKLGREAIEAAAARVEREALTASPDSALAQDLTGPRSPFWVEGRDLPREAGGKVEALTRELDALSRQVPPLPTAHGARDGGLRYGPSPGFGDAHVHVRGSDSRLGKLVPRRLPRALAGDAQPPIRSGSGRLELARWVASRDNPLTARVIVNRIWQHHFGEGLVRTPSNFGRLGEPPTHPELLDYLALRFVESGWSVKAAHRLVMLTDAYGRSSRATKEAAEADPENRLWGRMNRRRLEAEALHDSLLALAGRIDRRAGGPAERDPTSPRRLLALGAYRSDRSDFGSLFDRANASLHVEKRPVSTAAPQALRLMNSAWVMDLAGELAGRADVTAEGDPGRRVSSLYLLVLGRPATEAEVALGLEFLAGAGRDPAGGPPPWAQYAQALLLSNEFLFVD